MATILDDIETSIPAAFDPFLISADTNSARLAFDRYLTLRFSDSAVTNALVMTMQRKGNPIFMKDLIGDEGVRLYHSALKEEVNSATYRASVLQSSIKHFPGCLPDGMPITLIISGPSASGKTYASAKVMAHLLNTDRVDMTTPVMFVDGGILRDKSEVRNIVRHLAFSLGFKGVKDLRSQSEASLRPLKKLLRKCALNEANTMSIAMPDTFAPLGSTMSRPFTDKKSDISTMVSMPGRNLVVAEVVGPHRALFQTATAFLGESRAWQAYAIFDADKFNISDILTNKLRDESGAESKAYEKSNFEYGVNGSRFAGDWYCAKMDSSGKHATRLAVINDLHVYYQKPGTHTLLPMMEKCDEPILASARAVEDWIKFQRSFSGSISAIKLGLNVSTCPVSERALGVITPNKLIQARCSFKKFISLQEQVSRYGIESNRNTIKISPRPGSVVIDYQQLPMLEIINRMKQGIAHWLLEQNQSDAGLRHSEIEDLLTLQMSKLRKIFENSSTLPMDKINKMLVAMYQKLGDCHIVSGDSLQSLIGNLQSDIKTLLPLATFEHYLGTAVSWPASAMERFDEWVKTDNPLLAETSTGTSSPVSTDMSTTSLPTMSSNTEPMISDLEMLRARRRAMHSTKTSEADAGNKVVLSTNPMFSQE